jgi:hypothetical protein
VFPDGFSPLFRAAAALPALLVTPVSAVPPVALPVVVPLVEDPVVVLLVAALPVAELPLAEPLLDCASAQVPVKTSAVANPNVASFMIAPFSCRVTANEVRQAAFPPADHSSLLFRRRFPPATIWNRSDALEEK